MSAEAPQSATDLVGAAEAFNTIISLSFAFVNDENSSHISQMRSEMSKEHLVLCRGACIFVPVQGIAGPLDGYKFIAPRLRRGVIDATATDLEAATASIRLRYFD